MNQEIHPGAQLHTSVLSDAKCYPAVISPVCILPGSALDDPCQPGEPPIAPNDTPVGLVFLSQAQWQRKVLSSGVNCAQEKAEQQ